MEQKASYKDRKKLNLQVKREFQRWLLAKVLLAVAISAGLAATILYFYAHQEMVNSFYDAHVKIRRVSDLLLPVILVASVVSLAVGVYLAIFLPQKIAGPIYRIEQGLKEVAAGDLRTRITLRTGDTLQDFAESVSVAVASVRGRVHSLKEGQEQLREAIDAGDQERISELLARQAELLERLKT